MATAKESARVAELEAELTAYRVLLPDGKWSSPEASGQTEGERQMGPRKRTSEGQAPGEYKRKLRQPRDTRSVFLFFFGARTPFLAGLSFFLSFLFASRCAGRSFFLPASRCTARFAWRQPLFLSFCLLRIAPRATPACPQAHAC